MMKAAAGFGPWCGQQAKRARKTQPARAHRRFEAVEAVCNPHQSLSKYHIFISSPAPNSCKAGNIRRRCRSARYLDKTYGSRWINRSSLNDDPSADEDDPSRDDDAERVSSSDDTAYSTSDKRPIADQLMQKFLEPKIDDPGLPLADSLISGAIAPMSIAYFTLALGLPRPMWLVLPAGTPSGLRGLPYLGPTFLHGAVLASCWLVGALAASAFEEKRYKGERVVISTIQAGAFATGVLILINQLTLAVQMGTIPLLADPTPQTDVLIAQTTASLTLDIITEAFFILAWRLYRSGLP